MAVTTAAAGPVGLSAPDGRGIRDVYWTGADGRRYAYRVAGALAAWRVRRAVEAGDLEGAERVIRRESRLLPWCDIVPHLPPAHRDRRGYTA